MEFLYKGPSCYTVILHFNKGKLNLLKCLVGKGYTDDLKEDLDHNRNTVQDCNVWKSISLGGQSERLNS